MNESHLSEADKATVTAELKILNQKSLMLGAPGMVIQWGAWWPQFPPTVQVLCFVLGTALLGAGLFFAAKHKGLNGLLGLLGLFSCVGLGLLAVLPSKCVRCGSGRNSSAKECKACAAPMA